MARAKLPGLPGSGPLISVILPAYNVEAYVRHTLESLRRQSYHHLEVLMVDDGSTDGTHAILSEYADLDRRFILVSRANGGLSAARNTGLEKAKGEWIAFCDGDDEMLPRAIEILYQTAVRHHCAMAMGTYRECHLTSAGRRIDRPVSARPTVLRSAEACHRYFLTFGQFLNHMWTKLFRREVFDHVRFPEGRIYEDMATLPYLLEAAQSCCVVNKPVYRYMIRQGSLSTSLNIARQMDAIRARMDYAELMRTRCPELLGLANDAILPVICNMLGKIEHIGREHAQAEWDECIAIAKRILPECSLQSPIYRVGAWSFERDPTVVSKITHFLLVADRML